MFFYSIIKKRKRGDGSASYAQNREESVDYIDR